MADRAHARTVASVERLIGDGEYYAAHQKARTTVARLLKAPTTPDKLAQAADLLWQSSRQLLEKGELGSGTDLGLYLLEAWTAAGARCGDAERTKLRQLLALAGPTGTWRKQLADASFSWSAKCGSCPAGDLLLHAYLGEQLAKEKSYVAAEPHLLASASRESAELLAQMLYDWSLLDPAGVEASGKYAARGTLGYLEAECIHAARSFLARFLELLLAAKPDLLFGRVASAAGSTEDDFAITALGSLNYLQLAVRNCQIGVGEAAAAPKPGEAVKRGMGRAAWQSLFGRYEREIAWLRERDAKESREALSEIYFGIKPPTPQGNPMLSMLGNMLRGGGQ